MEVYPLLLVRVESSSFLFLGSLRHICTHVGVVFSDLSDLLWLNTKPKERQELVHPRGGGRVGWGATVSPLSSADSHLNPSPPRYWHGGLLTRDEWQGPQGEAEPTSWFHIWWHSSTRQMTNEYKINSPKPHPSESDSEAHTLKDELLKQLSLSCECSRGCQKNIRRQTLPSSFSDSPALTHYLWFFSHLLTVFYTFCGLVAPC